MKKSFREGNYIKLINGVEVDPSSYSHPLKVNRCCLDPCQTEPYIENGYMIPKMPVWYYWKTFYTLNYNLLNVWTHTIPAIFVLYKIFIFHNEVNVVEHWPLLFVSLGGLITFLLSTIAHTFHCRSGGFHRSIFTCDYLGISAFILGSFFSHFYTYTDLDFFVRHQTYAPYFITSISCLTLYSSAFYQMNRNKPCLMLIYLTLRYLCLICAFLFQCFIFHHRFLYLSENILNSRLHIIRQVLLVCSFALLALPYPEKLSPGSFDVFGHSHMIFHSLIAVSVFVDMETVYLEITSLNGNWIKLKNLDSYPKISSFYTMIVFYIAFSILILIYTTFQVQKDEEKQAFLKKTK